MDAEVAEARGLSAREGMAIIAEAEGWPLLRDGESVTEWMARCWMLRPCFEGGEPVAGGDPAGCGVVGGVAVWDDGSWVLYDMEGSEIDAGDAGSRVRRPEVLLRDGRPAEVGETVYGEDDKAWTVTALGAPYEAYPVHADGEDGAKRDLKTCWLTHEEPVTQDQIDEWATMPMREYYAERIGHNVGLLDDAEVYEAVVRDLLASQRAVLARGGE